MPKYSGKIVGEFTETQMVEAKDKEEAKQMLSENAGETMDRTASGHLEVSEIEEWDQIFNNLALVKGNSLGANISIGLSTPTTYILKLYPILEPNKKRTLKK